MEEDRLVGMAGDSGWRRVRVHGRCGADLGSWTAVERRARLAVASELVAVTQRILDVAADQVSTRRQFGRPIGANQSVRFRLAEGFAEVAGARALVAAAWEDGSPDASVWAKTVAGATHDSVAKHALQVCGAIGLSDEHPLPGLVRRGFSLDALLGNAMEQDVHFGSALPNRSGGTEDRRAHGAIAPALFARSMRRDVGAGAAENRRIRSRIEESDRATGVAKNGVRREDAWNGLSASTLPGPRWISTRSSRREPPGVR